jgi:predicted CXXCH cytochrome family protein
MTKANFGTFAALFAWHAVLLGFAAPAQAQTDIARTVHNLTPSGPGGIKATQPAAGLCVFCHTPHNANPTRALWNRELPGVTYQLYASSTLHAALNQPTGSSRLCLSCHDGLLALGNVRVPPPGAPLTLGPLTGPSVLGTDLSDDHPISFVYDGALAANRGGLVDPASLPSTLRLDQDRQLQCTTCHEPHEDRHPHFLRMSNVEGALCTSCHRPSQWSGSAHATSNATWKGTGVNPWPPGAGATVASNACLNCHRSHAAGHGQRLLARSDELENCTVCHNGAVAARNVAQEFNDASKPSRHPVESAPWTHDPKEDPATMPRHVTCADCHNPHAATGTPGTPPLVSGPLRGVAGATLAGTPLGEASHEYEVCSKCHGASEPTTTGITRMEATRIVRSKIDPNNASYHPLAAPGRNATLGGFMPGYTASSIISCTDCHNNSDWTPAGTAPRGAHASHYEPILERNYETRDPSPESLTNYDLCYKCHNRDYLINDRANTFPHKSHLEKQAPCAACHDAHGSRQNAHLINFMLRDRTGKAVVSATLTGQLEYISAGPGSGTCYLICHGAEHNPRSYPTP